MSSKQNQVDTEQATEQELQAEQHAAGEAQGQETIQPDAAYVAELEQKLADAEDKAKTEKDSALRAVAEMENIRRRAAQDVEKAQKFALEKFVGELLPVIDSLERAIEHTSDESDAFQAVHEGVELTLKSLLSAVEKFGVAPIDPKGQPFDPNKHQAMSMVESAEVAPNAVLAVMMKGYELNGRVLRPAMVMVAKGPAIDTQA
ncbi:nucleotide exchange factor GrpE [Oceanimonas baumannii]|uniref:Protein GrpE n=1 Tax=Oceanimonas baumannii TaxID=129578 RepID=A0A235CQH1_9GAMM|nr:nucleotide exchange factor GrpE [Oceanimonas baumannii]OYD26115.1 nucleotide exchange factor GrpE [Oceanimonas baumannii]TDW62240.1 molecular chaperone GrpE [Oceanimonas baumannii]